MNELVDKSLTVTVINVNLIYIILIACKYWYLLIANTKRFYQQTHPHQLFILHNSNHLEYFSNYHIAIRNMLMVMILFLSA